MSIYLGLDIGGTKIGAGLIRYESGEASILAFRRLEVREVRDVLAELRAVVEEMCCESGIARSDIVCCGAGIPGTVSRDGKRVLKAPNIRILSERFADALSDVLELPVTLLQDSRAAAWGEYLCGGGRGMAVVICITLGTGIGTGIVIDGRIYDGALGTAGELGHIPAVCDGRPCGCGKCGCLEKYCAGGGLDITARELLGQGNAARDLFAAAKLGNLEAQSAIDRAITLLGNAIVSAVNLLSPDCVLFSGGMSREGAFLDPLIAYITEHCYSSGQFPKLARATLGEHAPLIGAALGSVKS